MWQGNVFKAVHIPVVKFIYFWQVTKQHIPFVLQAGGREMAEL